jgi:hypothetical protein
MGKNEGAMREAIESKRSLPFSGGHTPSRKPLAFIVNHFL